MTERLKHNGGSIPEAKDFSICALRIGGNCAQKKCLRGGLYFFNDRLRPTQDGEVELNPASLVPHDLYGANIHIQALVGQMVVVNLQFWNYSIASLTILHSCWSWVCTGIILLNNSFM